MGQLLPIYDLSKPIHHKPWQGFRYGTASNNDVRLEYAIPCYNTIPTNFDINTKCSVKHSLANGSRSPLGDVSWGEFALGMF